MYIWPYSRALLQGAVQDKNSSHKTFAKPKVSSLRVYMCACIGFKGFYTLDGC